MNEENDEAEYVAAMVAREKRHTERIYLEDRKRFALAVFRDICAMERLRNVNRDIPEDFSSHACEAVEAADYLLSALKNTEPTFTYEEKP